MKISFVIPAYNEEEYLGDCIESVFREAKGKNYDLEVIVVNNSSTDKTKKVASSYKKVKVVDEPKKGLVYARKAGYLASTGDLIANIDSDSRLTPGWIDTVLSEFENDTKLVALSGPFIFYDLSKFMNRMLGGFYYYSYCLYFIAKKISKMGSMLQGGNFVLRKSAFEMVGGYDEKVYSFYGEDANIALKMEKVGKVKWTFKLSMYSSGRRLAAEGPFTMMLRYTTNYFWVLLFKKPFTKEFTDFRFKNKKILSIHPKDSIHELISATLTIGALFFLPLIILILIIYFTYTSLVPTQIPKN
jgi:glycosyltransferase involved in cell wall biosynthesis